MSDMAQADDNAGMHVGAVRSSDLSRPPPVRLITVHGTGAGDVTATGDRWWQLDSRFMLALGQRA